VRIFCAGGLPFFFIASFIEPQLMAKSGEEKPKSDLHALHAFGNSRHADV
jgi:hypothetical protein